MSYTIRKFQPETDIIKPFDCGVADLNGFLCRGRARGTTCSAQMGTGRGGQMGTARSAQ